MIEIVFGLILFGFFVTIVWLPCWWLAGWIDPQREKSLFRLPASVGLALVGYVSSVNLLGKLFDNSITAVVAYLILNLLASVYLLWKHRDQLDTRQLWKRRRLLVAIAITAVMLALPQWFQAVSGNRWDEAASSSIHLTAQHQFAEGVFPPRHNAFPDITIKYHYGFTLLSGTVHWLTGLSSNASIDVVSTGLWLFIFLFAFFWLLEVGVKRIAALWGSFALLLGGGLSWLFLPNLEIYKNFRKQPPPDWLTHSYDYSSSWLDNLLTVNQNQNIHLRTGDGDLFSLPFDIAIHYQQHAVALGIALALVAAYLFWLWQTRKGFAPALLILSAIACGVVFLGHAVFGGITSLSAGLVLVVLWLLRPTSLRVAQGVVFTLGVTILAFLHGGMMSWGEEYGPGAILKFRDDFGYISGSLVDQGAWHLAGFGLPLVLACLAVLAWFQCRRDIPPQRTLFFVFFGVFGLVSYMIPQLAYFSHGTGLEEQTEISKFFFCTHLAIAIVSVLGVDYLVTRWHWRWWVFMPIFAVSAVTPVAVSVAAGLGEDGSWMGFYKSPYDWRGGTSQMAAGKVFRQLKDSNLDGYYNFSSSERESGFLSELLVYGGSAFSLTALRYEVTGSGFLISEERVQERVVMEGRVGRLLPGSMEQSGTNWIYASSERELVIRPVIVKSRFAKMLATGLMSDKFRAGARSLYKIENDTGNLDDGIERYWAPKIISQAHTDWDGDGDGDLVFFDYLNKSVLVGEQSIPLPQSPGAQGDYEFPMIFLAKFQGDERADLVLGRMDDALYRRGETVSKMIRQYQFHWRRWDSVPAKWQDGYQYWFWGSPVDIPFIGDHDNDGFDSQFAFRPKTSQWFQYMETELDGPGLPRSKSPLPVIGRFLPGSQGDLAVWSPTSGEFNVQSIGNGTTASVSWGGRPGDVLLPGDYDGDGYDEVGLWQPHTNTWWVKVMPEGPDLRFSFGSPTGIPLPFDYNNDGRLDLAYWERSEQKIHISFDYGQSIGRSVEVPAHSIPIFVHMY